MSATTTNSKLIPAPKKQVYHAFTDKDALAFWLAPNNMKGKVHQFELKVGGGYSMSLYYQDSVSGGKTTGNEDRFHATFVELEPYEKIVQAIQFDSDKNKFEGEMMMEVHLAESGPTATLVTITFKNIPPGIDPKDNEKGTQQSLEKLAEYMREH
ncbi:MAG: SRPBCC family protein [Chitinophaga sp.]|uniref:SRPBCC family protein n=1 Tax=Chitinophaga sp. TaxID=1869181 RepID=UPI0025C39BF3|nr:SRPBCC family protein [Chitinophaga sp.]MBV8251058.1 SRPBCC family protein [Chitinophaga sp.]